MQEVLPEAEVSPAEEIAVEDTAPAEEPPYEPPTPEQAHAWLASIRAAPLLALLREPDFALIAMGAFVGFRVNAQSYGNPIVRARLAQVAVRDAAFAERLRSLAEQAAPPSLLPFPAPADAPQQPVSAHSEADHADAAHVQEEAARAKKEREEAQRTRRNHLLQERDEARYAQREAETARDAAEAARSRAEKERDEAQKAAGRQAQTVTRLERSVARLQTEQTMLLRRLKQTADASAERKDAGLTKGAAQRAPVTDDALWQEAVTRLLDKGRFDAARALAEDVLRAAPDNPAALDIAARAHEGKGDTRAAAAPVRRLLLVHLERGRSLQAIDVLLRLLRLLPPAEAERDARALLLALRPEDKEAVASLRAALVRLRSAAPDTHDALATLVRAQASPALVEALLPTPGALGPDDPLPLDLPRPPSAALLLAAVGSGDVEAVTLARDALGRVAAASPDDWGRIRAALERAAGDDLSALHPLLNTPRGPVVVDSSNVAYYDQEALTAGRPRLRHLRAMRRALRLRGGFPVVFIADANLPYLVDEPDALAQMQARQELRLVDAGTVADIALLREAKRLSAPIVTNDYMADWDHAQAVRKIRYTLSPGGDVYFDQEIFGA